jgi:hypothetical protein
MKSGRMARRIVATAGMGAILAMGALSACAKEEQKAPETTTITKTITAPAAPPATPAPPTAPPLEPTEKAPRIEPGPNPFSPTVIAPPAPTAVPGDH